MNEPKDDLLAAFENPDMAVPEMPQEAVSNTVPEAPVVPAPEVPVTPVAPTPQAPVQNVVPQAPVGPASVQNVAPTPVEPVQNIAPQAPVEQPMGGNQNVMPNVSAEPAVEVNRDVKAEEPKAEGSSLKKNLAFIIIICALIAVFIFFLPTIMSFISGGSY